MLSQRWPDALAKQAGLGVAGGQRVGAVRVPDAEGDLDGLAADPRGCRGEGAEVLHVTPRRDVAGVARLQLVVQALH